MRYFLIAGEASGDLHAAHLIRAIRQNDPEARFQGFGGDLMAAEGMKLLRHYRTLAFMGFVQVALHLPTILRGMTECKNAIRKWKPDCVILIDYPGFNLNIAAWVKRQKICPTFYYIAPKIWAWKEGRIHRIRRDIDRIFSILPFEVDFFGKKHHYPISYVGNPSLDEIEAFRHEHPADREAFCRTYGLNAQKNILALLAGSRRSEIAANLPRMLAAVRIADPEGHTQPVLAAAPSIDDADYAPYLKNENIVLVRDATFSLLQHAHAALVTSGTATLETALFGVPQVVCYHIRGGRLINRLRPLFLKCPYISLVNLIANREIVPELIAADMTPSIIADRLKPLIAEDSPERDDQLRGYATLRHRLGEVGAPFHAAKEIVARLSENHT